MTTALAKPMPAPIEIGDGGTLRLRSYEDALAFARSVVASKLAPACFSSPEAVLVAMQHGAELGLKPMQSLQSIAVINGRPSLYGDAIPALLMASGQCEVFEEWVEGTGDDMTSLTKLKRKGMASEMVGRFSVADAKRAGLWGKSGPWTQYPKDMLRHKSRARAARTIFADVLKGLPVFEDIRESIPPAREALPARDPLLATIGATQELKDATPVQTPEGASISSDPEPEPEYGELETITLAQADDLRAMAAEVKADPARFCKFLGVENFNEIPAAKFQQAMHALELKHSAGAGKGTG